MALPSGTTLTVEREVCDKLFFILDGSAAMSLNGQHTTTIHRGGFVNTLAVQEGQRQKAMGGVASYGTIRSSGETRAIAWDLTALGLLLESEPELARRMNHVLVASLMRRLLRSRDGEAVADYIGDTPEYDDGGNYMGSFGGTSLLERIGRRADLTFGAGSGGAPRLVAPPPKVPLRPSEGARRGDGTLQTPVQRSAAGAAASGAASTPVAAVAAPTTTETTSPAWRRPPPPPPVDVGGGDRRRRPTETDVGGGGGGGLLRRSPSSGGSVGRGSPPGSPLQVPTELMAGTPSGSLLHVRSKVWHEQRSGSGSSARSADALPRRSPPLSGLGLDPHLEPLTELALCATEPLTDDPLSQSWTPDGDGGRRLPSHTSASNTRRRRASQGDMPAQRNDLPEAKPRRQLFTSELLSSVRRAAAPPTPEPPRSTSFAPPRRLTRATPRLCLRVGMGVCGCVVWVWGATGRRLWGRPIIPGWLTRLFTPEHPESPRRVSSPCLGPLFTHAHAAPCFGMWACGACHGTGRAPP